ncbi:MAG TPA: ATP-binding protein [Kofleriaceae bacterium]
MEDDGPSLVSRLRDGLRLVSTVVQAFAEPTPEYLGSLDAIARDVADVIPDMCAVLLRTGESFAVVALQDGQPDAGVRFAEVLNRPYPGRDSVVAAGVLANGPLIEPWLDTWLDVNGAGHGVAGCGVAADSVEKRLLAGATGMIVVPLAARGESIGVLWLLRHGGGRPPLDELDLEILIDLANHAALAVSNARLFKQLERAERLRQVEERAVLASSQAIAELQAAKLAAEDANRELESFSYSVAHDLRTPLRAIDGFSQALVEDYGDRLDVEGRRYLTRVREAAQRMAELIDDLLTLSRVTRSELRRDRVDLSALAHTLLAAFQRVEPARQVEISIEPDIVAEADPQLVAIALDNLLGNAWKFTSKLERARIEVGLTQAHGVPAYFVRDNGAGFDMTYRDKLFGVFQRLHPESEFPGTGIGLATVARIAQRHRGRAWAVGVPGEGATFFFTLTGPALHA